MNSFGKLKKKGFTLIELLIVIAIIGTLVAVSVSSYQVVREKVRLDIAANTLQSVIVDAREKARSGIYQSSGEITEGTTFCFGVVIKKGEYIEVYKTPYDRLSKKNNQCNRANAELVESVEHDARLVVKEIEYFGDEIDEVVEVFFAPPKAEVELSSTLIGQGEPLLKIVVGYKNTDKPGDKKLIVLNLLTGNVYSAKYEE